LQTKDSQWKLELSSTLRPDLKKY